METAKEVKAMRFFVTGVGGQLGHDVMNELSGRGHEGVGSDIAPSYSGIADGTPVTTMPYVQLDITDKEAVAKTIREVKPDAVVHCAAWTAVDAAEDEENREKVRLVNVSRNTEHCGHLQGAWHQDDVYFHRLRF